MRLYLLRGGNAFARVVEGYRAGAGLGKRSCEPGRRRVCRLPEGAASAESGAAAEGSRNGSAPAAGSGIACDVSADAVDDARASKKKRSRSLFLTNPVVRTLFFLSLLMGCFFGIFDTATVSFAQIELNDPVFASLILAIESLAVSTIAGFVFGMILSPHVKARRCWRSPS